MPNNSLVLISCAQELIVVHAKISATHTSGPHHSTGHTIVLA